MVHLVYKLLLELIELTAAAEPCELLLVAQGAREGRRPRRHFALRRLDTRGLCAVDLGDRRHGPGPLRFLGLSLTPRRHGFAGALSPREPEKNVSHELKGILRKGIWRCRQLDSWAGTRGPAAPRSSPPWLVRFPLASRRRRAAPCACGLSPALLCARADKAEARGHARKQEPCCGQSLAMPAE